MELCTPRHCHNIGHTPVTCLQTSNCTVTLLLNESNRWQIFGMGNGREMLGGEEGREEDGMFSDKAPLPAPFPSSQHTNPLPAFAGRPQ